MERSEIMPSEIQIGARLEYRGATVGWVEAVQIDPRRGTIEAVLVRSGRANYLLRVPSVYLIIDSPSRLRIDPRHGLDELEQLALDSGLLPPIGEHLTDAGATEPSPIPAEVLGTEPGLPSFYDAPATS